MKKNFTTPSLKMELFNKELILQASGTQQPTNLESAKGALRNAGIDESKTVTITL